MTETLDRALSHDLKAGTAAAHERAEGSTFMARLLSGELDRGAAVALTGQLYFVYEALENAARVIADSRLGEMIVDRRLERVPALAQDLENMLGSSWRDEISAHPATLRYVGVLEELAAAAKVGEDVAPEIIAHHYVRYLGDMSGGQVIARRFQEFYGLGEKDTAFYDFSVIGKIKPYRDSYRARLDALELTPAQRERLIAAASDAFILNIDMFNDLATEYDSRMA